MTKYRRGRSGELLKETDYAFAVAKVRAVEGKLLNAAKYDRMIEAGTIDEAVRIMSEAGYGNPGESLGSRRDFESLISDESGKTYDFVRGILPDKEIFDIFKLRNDYHNIKVILKAEYYGSDAAMPLTGNGTIEPAKLRDMIREDKLGDMPPVMSSGVKNARAAYNETRDPHSIDLELDNALYRHMSEEAESRKIPVIRRILTQTADLTNLRTFIRARRLNKSREYFEKMFLEGGSIGIAALADHYSEPLHEVLRGIRGTAYGSLIDQALNAYLSEGKLTAYEKLSDDFILDSLRFAKYKSFGIEPVIAYFYAKETELKNIRIIIVGKINGLKPEMIRERMRKPYV